MPPADFHGLTARSAAMRDLFGQIRRIAGAGGAVLLKGESGVGKELVARAIHAESPRRDGPFVAINCAGIPSGLLESELFGHVEGAFTDARRTRAGLFAEAEGGTLLLDEIGEMPVEMQARLLRVLEGGRIRPVGANEERIVDVRVIAATHRDLEAMVADGAFRADLFFRLETFVLRIPPLRERPEDIRPLALRFIAGFAAQTGKTLKGLTPAALARLQCCPFPGNVRELANAMEHAVALCRRPRIDVSDLPERLRGQEAGDGETRPTLPALFDEQALPTLRELDRRYVHYVLARHGGNKLRAAETLGIGRRTLYRYLESD